MSDEDSAAATAGDPPSYPLPAGVRVYPNVWPGEALPVQPGDVFYASVQGQEKRWGTGMGGDLSGCMGGDGDWAKESLCCSFMVENPWLGVCRLWSRAELVTK